MRARNAPMISHNRRLIITKRTLKNCNFNHYINELEMIQDI